MIARMSKSLDDSPVDRPVLRLREKPRTKFRAMNWMLDGHRRGGDDVKRMILQCRILRLMLLHDRIEIPRKADDQDELDLLRLRVRIRNGVALPSSPWQSWASPSLVWVDAEFEVEDQSCLDRRSRRCEAKTEQSMKHCRPKYWKCN